MERRILVADKIADEGVEYLQSQPGFKVDVVHGLDAQEDPEVEIPEM